MDGFFKTFDTKDDFIYGDEVITSADDSIDATEMYYLKMLDRNPYAVSGDAQDNAALSDNEAGLTIDKESLRFLGYTNTYNFSAFDASQSYNTSLDQTDSKYKGSFRLKLSPMSHVDSVEYFRNHAYAISNDMQTWEEAERICEDMGGHLVVIDDAEENAYIRDLAIEAGKEGYVAIGFTDEENEGRWKWVVPTDSTYTCWNDGEPNDGSDFIVSQDYAYMYENGTWDDGYGRGELRYYVCEWDNIESVASYELSAVAVTMRISGDLDVDVSNDNQNETNNVIIKTLPSGEKELIWKADIEEGAELVIPVEVSEDDAFSTLIRNINIRYSVVVGTDTYMDKPDEPADNVEANDAYDDADNGDSNISDQFKIENHTEILDDISFVNTSNYEEGVWTAIVDSGKEGSCWNYFDIDGSYETSSSMVLCAFASDDLNDVYNNRYSTSRRITREEACSEEGIQDVRGRYLSVAVYFYSSRKNTVPFLDNITVGADTSKRPVKRDKECLLCNISGDDILNVNEAAWYTFSAVTR